MPIDVLPSSRRPLAYRAAQVQRGAPPGFAASTFESSTRQPVPIVAHITDLMEWGVTLARGDYVWKADGRDDWNTYTFARSEARPALSVGPGPCSRIPASTSAHCSSAARFSSS
jgi:hypothetical protein